MKRIITVFIAGILLGLFFLFIKIGFNIPNSLFWNYYFIIGALIIILTLIINISYNLYFSKKMERLSLLHKKDSQEYVKEMQELLKKARGKNLCNAIRINIAAGYIQNKNYDEALNILEAISFKELKGELLKLVFCIDICVAYIKSDSFEKAKEVYLKNQSLFYKYKNNGTYGVYISQVEIFLYMNEGEYEKARELLELSKNKTNDEALIKEFEKIEEILNEVKEAD